MAHLENNTFAGHCILSIPNPLPPGITRTTDPVSRPRIILLGCHTCNTIWRAGRSRRFAVYGSSEVLTDLRTRAHPHNSDCSLSTSGIRAAYSMSIWAPAWQCWACNNINKENPLRGYDVCNSCRKCGMTEGVGCVRGWAIGPGEWDELWPKGLVEDLEDIIRTAASARDAKKEERGEYIPIAFMG